MYTERRVVVSLTVYSFSQNDDHLIQYFNLQNSKNKKTNLRRQVNKDQRAFAM